MTKQNQIVAIEKGVKTTTGRDITNLYQLIQKPDLQAGITKTYQPRDDEGEQLPAESKLVQVKLPVVLEDLGKHFTRLFDVVLTKDSGNMIAKADVVVEGVTIVKDAPVPFLLFLEKQLVDLQTVVRALPTLDPADSWHYDTNSGVYRTEPKGTTRGKKVPQNHVKAPPTDKHPAQVEMYFEDVIVGTWETVKLSGALPADRRNQLVERMTALIEAVKYAREQANTVEVTDRTIGAVLFGYLLAD